MVTRFLCRCEEVKRFFDMVERRGMIRIGKRRLVLYGSVVAFLAFVTIYFVVPGAMGFLPESLALMLRGIFSLLDWMV